MASVNKAILLGNLGKDPEVRVSQYGKKMATFSVATSESWIDKETGTKQERVEWHKVVVHNENLAIFTEKFLKKGMKVYVEGKLCAKKWIDKNGTEHTATEIVLSKYDGTIIIASSMNTNAHVGGSNYSSVSKTSENNLPADPYADIDFPFNE